jgi:hypothetical protein
MRKLLATLIITLLLCTFYGVTWGQLAGFRTQFRYIGNTQSQLLHLIYYQHLPPDSMRLNFQTLQEAVNAGYRKCPICFPPTPLIPGYDFERRLGMETAGVVNYYYPAPVNVSFTEKLRKEGSDIISHWPFPLKGYNYSFLAITSEEIKAFSCATGVIYLTSGLMDIIESRGELDMILAHEIAHVEQRHALTEYRQESQATFENDPVSVANRLHDFARSQILIGYSNDHEHEADFYALAYGVRRYDMDHSSLSLVLQKLRDVQWRDLRVGGGLFSGRSDLDERMRVIQEVRIEPFSGNITFYRKNSEGEVEAEINLLFQKLYQGRLTLFTSIESDETIRFNTQGLSQIVITSNNETYTLVQDNISFIRKPPEGMEREIDHHTYVITFTTDGVSDPIPLSKRTIRKIALMRQLGPVDREPLIEFIP